MALAVLGALSAGTAHADIWTFTDSSGVVHFTNLGPRKGWKRIYKTGPGKASASRGECKGCDVVPPRDRTAARYSRYDESIREAASVYQIPELLIRAIIQCESDFDSRVVSRAGAQGLMQLMPGTQKMMRVTDVWNPRLNILGGTRLLRVLANQFNGDLVRTIAGYHAGAGAVERYGGVPPYATTQLYVKLVLKEYYDLRARDTRSLPRVLLIGDSISMGYHPFTARALEGRAVVLRPDGVNCGNTHKGVAEIQRWLGGGGWDVVHFNFGLHDAKRIRGRNSVPIETYERNLAKIVAKLKQTGAKLIWGNTTPVQPGYPGLDDADIVEYNAAAQRIMEANGIEVNDLYGFALPVLERIQPARNCHFTPAGSRTLAGQVAAAIRSGLEQRASVRMRADRSDNAVPLGRLAPP